MYQWINCWSIEKGKSNPYYCASEKIVPPSFNHLPDKIHMKHQ